VPDANPKARQMFTKKKEAPGPLLGVVRYGTELKKGYTKTLSSV